MVENLQLGMGVLLQPLPLSLLFVGLLLGFIAGALPGIESSLAAALILPLAMLVPAEAGAILIVAIYAGANFAGSVPAILLNVPGTPGSAVTAIDGHPISQAGRPGFAIGIARSASTFGGTLSIVIIIAAIGPIAAVAFTFTSPETFLAILFGLLLIGSVAGQDKLKGLVSVLLGLLIASMGANSSTAQGRLTFGQLELYQGLPFIPVLIGLFAITEMLLLAQRKNVQTAEAASSRGTRMRATLLDAWQGIGEVSRHPRTVVRSSIIGLGAGIIPGVGTTLGNLVAYDRAKRSAGASGRFGRGDVRGVIASESADNSVVSGTLIPTLTLGIPGSGTAAIMLAALYLQGYVPGPQFMADEPSIAYAILISVLIASIAILPVGTVLSAPLAALVKVRPAFLVPGVCVVALLGSYSLSGSMFDVGISLFFGALGLLLRSNGYPVLPLLLALILAPMAEDNLLRTLELGGGGLGVFLSSPTAIVLVAGFIGVVGWSIVRSILQRGVNR